MTDCPFELNVNGLWQCPRKGCGWVYPLKSDKPPRRNCPKAPSRGFGDTIAKITRFFGIKPCGRCKKRQAKLNRLLPYRQMEDRL